MVKKSLVVVAVFAAMLVADPSFAYQVTGPVLEITDTKIVVQKGKERWELTRDAATKLPADVKVGSKVTIQYSMTATSVDMKAGAGKKSKN